MGACRSCWRPRSAPSRSSTTFRRPTFGRRWPHSQGSALTSETSAPYNGSAMTVDDPAITGAIRRHEERLQRDPESLAFAQLADLYRKSGRARDAIALCRRGLDRYPHYTTARLILAKTLLGEGDHDAALAELTSILGESPKEAQAQRLTEEALNIFIRILRKEPNNADARAGLEGALRARLKRRG